MNDGGLSPEVYNQKSMRQVLFFRFFGVRDETLRVKRQVDAELQLSSTAPCPQFSSIGKCLRRAEFVVPLFSVWSILAATFAPGWLIPGLALKSLVMGEANLPIGDSVVNLYQKDCRAGKFGLVLVIFLSSAATSIGQGSRGPSTPNIEILKLHWERQIQLPRNFDPSTIPTGGTFNDPASRSALNTVAPVDLTRAATSAQAAAATSNNTFPLTPGRLPIFYVYSMKIRNTGARLIEGIAWDYLFIDPNSNTELGKHQFLSYERIPVNKSATLKSQLRSPPIRVIRTADPPKNSHGSRPKFIERAVIQCVLYADDTVWKNPSARDDACELLKNSKTLIKRKAARS